MKTKSGAKQDLWGLVRLGPYRGASSQTAHTAVLRDELFPPPFIRRHTRFANMAEFAAASGFAISDLDYPSLQDTGLDEFVRREAGFDSWFEMVRVAAVHYLHRRYGP